MTLWIIGQMSPILYHLPASVALGGAGALVIAVWAAFYPTK